MSRLSVWIQFSNLLL